MMAYALVSNEIIQYDESTLQFVQSEWDPRATLVNFTDSLGCECVTTEGNFTTGTLKELQNLIDVQIRIQRDKIKSVYDKYPNLTETEKQIVEYLVDDGVDPDQIEYEDVHHMVHILCSDHYRECYNSLFEAYMDYVH